MNILELIDQYEHLLNSQGRDAADQFLVDAGVQINVAAAICAAYKDVKVPFYDVTFVARRENEELFAIITARVTDQALTDESAFLSELQRATTLWIQSGEHGKKAFVYAGDDLDIGDIIGFDAVGNLVELMPEVAAMEVRAVHNDPNHGLWFYDTRLINVSDLPENFYETT